MYVYDTSMSGFFNKKIRKRIFKKLKYTQASILSNARNSRNSSIFETKLEKGIGFAIIIFPSEARVQVFINQMMVQKLKPLKNKIHTRKKNRKK